MTETGSPLPLLSRYAIMIDVGYIYASAGELLFSAASRREYRVDADKLIQALTRHAEDQVRGELLRVYWYDAARDRVPTIDQRVIAQMPWVKLRLGNLNARGQQKGVDAQIRADMAALARHRLGADRRGRGHGARGRGGPGVRGPGPPVGHRAAVRHQPGRAPGLGVGHGRRARRLVPAALLQQEPRRRRAAQAGRGHRLVADGAHAGPAVRRASHPRAADVADRRVPGSVQQYRRLPGHLKHGPDAPPGAG